jgi:HSP90 family molecular chaperone
MRFKHIAGNLIEQVDAERQRFTKVLHSIHEDCKDGLYTDEKKRWLISKLIEFRTNQITLLEFNEAFNIPF